MVLDVAQEAVFWGGVGAAACALGVVFGAVFILDLSLIGIRKAVVREPAEGGLQ